MMIYKTFYSPVNHAFLSSTPCNNIVVLNVYNSLIIFFDHKTNFYNAVLVIAIAYI